MKRLSRAARRQTAAAIFIGTLVCAAAARAENDPQLSAALQPLIAAHSGDAAVAIQQLPSGAAFVYHADEPFPTASLIKLPIMVAAYRLSDQGRLDLEQKVVLTDEDKALGSGVLTEHFSAGTELSVRDYIRLMIAYSDNTATNTVIDQIGLATTAETLEALGLANTKLHLCAEIGRAVATRFGGVSTTSDLRAGSAGRLVVSLQRTLNARLQPAPGLAVDGDFGPHTQAAVERFQREHELEVRGVVDAATWQALGTLIESDAPVPPPDIVNSEVLPTQPQPPLDGPPSVTCRAWAIGGASTGEVLSESASAERLQPASTTKIKTALVVLRWAASRPEVMDETVTFSARAEDTVGSSSKLRAGEQVSVRELLYGLLLPSGNDAAVALRGSCTTQVRRVSLSLWES